MNDIAVKLDFRPDGGFRILQLTDLHLITTERPVEFQQTLDLVKKSIEDTKPDLVAITGDLTWGETMDDVDAVNALVEVLAACNVPWAPVLGNHDGDKIGRGTLANMLLDRPGSLFTMGNPKAEGHGNYILSVGDEWFLYMLDSHNGAFLPGQVNWYRETSAALPAGHRELAFFHVPLPEYLEAWDYGSCTGYNMEGVCATDMNDGLFAAMVRGGAMRGTFVGHDHINDFEGTLRGIRLCYGRGSGYQCYGLEGYPHGGRIIDVCRGASNFHTQIYLETGEIYTQVSRNKPKLLRK